MIAIADRIPVPCWARDAGPDQDVVVSTRCRVARNLPGVFFPDRASDADREHVARLVLRHVEASTAARWRYAAIPAADLDAHGVARLIDRRFVSPEWAAGGAHRWVLIAADGALSVMVNEEDHLRFQAIIPGLQVESSLAYDLDAAAAAQHDLGFACDARFGYLTASPANAGTGIRVSVLLHLPALAASRELDDLLVAAEQTGCTVRGLHGEGTRGAGAFFQVSCMRTARIEPIQAARRTGIAARYLVDAERRARQARFGTAKGRADLKAAALEALETLFAEEAAPRRLVPLVSVLRLAAAEGVLRADLSATAEWLALAGGGDAALDGTGERFEAVRRSAALRSRIRSALDT